MNKFRTTQSELHLGAKKTENIARQNIAQYAVLGNPIHHSLSPFIHHLFAEQTEQQIHYSTMLVQPHRFAHVLAQIQKEKIKGINITSPFKQTAFHCVDSLTERAYLAQAINTIRFNDDGSRLGDNTDGYGLVRDLLHNLNVSLSNKRLLILGAGGAVNGILGPLLAEHPTSILIANRTEEKANMLASSFAHLGNVSACNLSYIPEHPFDLIINTINNKLPFLPNSIITQNTFCYDLLYAQQNNTAFLQWAKQRGIISYSDGIGMLVEQAAESFFLWRGIKPITKPIISILKNRL